jgi:hypothetical protein
MIGMRFLRSVCKSFEDHMRHACQEMSQELPRDVARVCHPFISFSKDADGRPRVLQVQVFLSYAAPLEFAHANGDPNVSTTSRLEVPMAIPVDGQRQGTPLSAAIAEKYANLWRSIHLRFRSSCRVPAYTFTSTDCSLLVWALNNSRLHLFGEPGHCDAFFLPLTLQERIG